MRLSEIMKRQVVTESGRSLGRVAGLVRFGLFSLGFSMFLDETRALVSDAQFTWGERRIMGIVGLSYLGGLSDVEWAVQLLLLGG